MSAGAYEYSFAWSLESLLSEWESEIFLKLQKIIFIGSS